MSPLRACQACSYWLWSAGLASVLGEGHVGSDFTSTGLEAPGWAFGGGAVMMCTHGFALVWDYTGSDRTVIGVRGAFSKIPKHSSGNLLFPSSVQLSIRSIKKKKKSF